MTAHWRFSVTELVGFCCRYGDLYNPERSGVSSRDGIRAHQRLQKRRGDGYEKEVSIHWQGIVDGDIVELSGRIDGAWPDSQHLEEIKTIAADFASIADNEKNEYRAQLKLYGFAYCESLDLEHCNLSLCLYDLRKDREHREDFAATRSELRDFAMPLMRLYSGWLREQQRHREQRDRQLKAMEFPYPEPRPSQRLLTENIYKAISTGSQFLIDAPTGAGKTLSVLFPALKSLANEKTSKLVWLSAKTSGQSVVLEHCHLLLGEATESVRVLQIEAKAKQCFCRQEQESEGICPYTVGYYDRLPDARREALALGHLDAANVSSIARKHRLCPFEFSFDLIPWCELVIADYNYVFDPLVRIGALLEAAKNSSLLIDEVHNLGDRVRGMHSIDIDTDALQVWAKQLRSELPSASKAIKALDKTLRSCDSAESFFQPLQDCAEHILEISRQGTDSNTSAECGEAIRDWIRIASLCELFADYDRHYLHEGRNWQQQCLDPAPRSQATLSRFAAVIAFSGSLTPAHYYLQETGIDADCPQQQLPSPFGVEQSLLCICENVDTRYRYRQRSLPLLNQLVFGLIDTRPGNYLLAFPSYAYLQLWQDSVPKEHAAATQITTQQADWNDQDIDALTRSLQAQQGQLVAGVLGGRLCESIDFKQGSLSGVIIVGVGLPGLSPVRDDIQSYYQEQGLQGYDFAYRFPGWQRVVQTAGRLIRRSEDRGVVVLVDPRLGEQAYQQLFPRHWQPQYTRMIDALLQQTQDFWNTVDATRSNSKPDN